VQVKECGKSMERVWKSLKEFERVWESLKTCVRVCTSRRCSSLFNILGSTGVVSRTHGETQCLVVFAFEHSHGPVILGVFDVHQLFQHIEHLQHGQ
jgi:hypothetical protein